MSYSFNNAEELNKIYYDPKLRTFLYREGEMVCVVARFTIPHLPEQKPSVYPTGNQNCWRYFEQDDRSFRGSGRSERGIPLLPYRLWSSDYKINYPVNDSMIAHRERWVKRILDAKKRLTA